MSRIAWAFVCLAAAAWLSGAWAQDLEKAASNSDGASPRAGMGWNCGAVPSFDEACEAIRDAVEGSFARWVPLTAFDSAAERPLHPLLDTVVQIRAVAAGTAIELDFNSRMLSGKHIGEFLLAADSLLPHHITSIAISNLTLTSPLRLEGTSFGRALSLNVVRLDPVLDTNEACSTVNTISFDGTSFERPVSLNRIWGCGGVAVIGAKFTHGLLFTGGTFGRLDHITVSKSKIDHEFYLFQVRTDRIMIDHSDIDVVQLREVRTNVFQTRDSSLFSLSSQESLIARSLRIVGNQFKDSVVLGTLNALQSGESESLYVADNTIGGRLIAGIGAAVGSDPFGLGFHNNQVTGSADLLVERGVSANIDVRGSTFDSELLLSLACPTHATDGAWNEDCLEQCAIRRERLPDRRRTLCVVPPDSAPQPSEPHGVLRIDLTGAKIGTLIWNFPDDPAHYKWKGAGLRYEYWDPVPKRGLRPYRASESSERAAALRIRDWGGQLEADDAREKVDALAFLAEYQKSHGYVTESGDTRRAALSTNRANYIDGVYQKLKVEFDSSNYIHASLTAAEWAGNKAFYYMLAPVGWGANPERALIIMAVLTVIFWCVYVIHSFIWRNTWPEVSSERGWVISIPVHQLTPLGLSRGDHPGRGLHEPAALPVRGEPVAQSVPVGGDAISIEIRRHEDRSRQHQEEPAYSRVPGFNQYNSTFPPRTFNLFVYSVDAMLPVINLHHFDRYYPSHPSRDGWQFVRVLSISQHGLGWLLSTLFLASLLV